MKHLSLSMLAKVAVVTAALASPPALADTLGEQVKALGVEGRWDGISSTSELSHENICANFAMTYSVDGNFLLLTTGTSPPERTRIKKVNGQTFVVQFKRGKLTGYWTFQVVSHDEMSVTSPDQTSTSLRCQ